MPPGRAARRSAAARRRCPGCSSAISSHTSGVSTYRPMMIEVARRILDRRLLDQVAHRDHPVGRQLAGRIDHAVGADLLARAPLDDATTLPPSMRTRRSSGRAATESPISSSGSMHGERLVADRLAGATDGVAEALRLVLVDDRHPPVASRSLRSRSASSVLPLSSSSPISASSRSEVAPRSPACRRLLTR